MIDIEKLDELSRKARINDEIILHLDEPNGRTFVQALLHAYPAISRALREQAKRIVKGGER